MMVYALGHVLGCDSAWAMVYLMDDYLVAL